MALLIAITNAPIASAFDDFYSDSEIQFIDPNACDPTGANSETSPNPSGNNTATSGPVYMMGDSLTVGVKSDLEKKLRENNLEISKINGVGSRSMTSGGDGSTNGPQAIEGDAKEIETSKTAILALGTNGSGSASAFTSQVKDLVKKTRDAANGAGVGAVASIKVYYLNIFSQVSHKDGYNNALKDLAASEGFTIIGTGGANIELGPDKVHPTGPGYKTLAKTIADNLASANPGSPQNLDTPAGCCPAASGESKNSPLSGSDNEEKTWNYFIDKGLEPEIVAGIMGNISQESGFNPENIQNPGGNTKNPSNISAGWGLIQWTPGSKIIGIAKQAGITSPIHELGTQLEIIWWHANNTSPTGAKNILPELKKANSPKAAASAWEHLMEGAGNPQMPNRWAAAEAALDKYGKKGGGGGSAAPASSNKTGGTCVCEDPSASGAVDVVLDPGHSGEDRQGREKDSETGLFIGDSSNPAERKQVWDVAQKVKDKLEEKSYKVALTKKKEDSYVNLKERADIANSAKADIAVSIHSTPGAFGSDGAGWVTPQKVGGYRTNDAGKKTEFKDADIAKKSEKYSGEIVKARKDAEGGATLHDLNFDGRAGLSPGNLSAVQLFSKVPWVYNEVGQSGFNEDKYADGIANGIMKSLGSSAGGDPGGPSKAEEDCTGPVTGDLAATAKNYAHPQYHEAPFVKPREAYKKAIEKARDDGQYIGGIRYPGIDCGGYVTRLLIDSGFEPKYNYSGKASGGAGPTDTQEKWTKENWKTTTVKSTADLQPGDVAFRPGHTYLFVGKVDGFSGPNPQFSSSSLDGRAPMAGQGNPLSAEITWYRKK